MPAGLHRSLRRGTGWSFHLRAADLRLPHDLQRQWLQGTGPAAKPNSPIKSSLRNVAYALLSGALGGTVSVIGGGKFANGAITAAYSALFNEYLHNGQKGEDEAKDDKAEFNVWLGLGFGFKINAFGLGTNLMINGPFVNLYSNINGTGSNCDITCFN